jgi:transcriptional regulator with XRE-family HTH domain
VAGEKAIPAQAALPVIEIGTKIRFTRRLRSLTLKEVAAATGCSESLLSKIENGHASPSLKMLQRLTHALGLTIGNLFAQEADPDDRHARCHARDVRYG